MKILFLGTHGQYNLGDELLLETFLDQLGVENSYTVNSYDPAGTQARLELRFKLTAFHTTRQLPRFLLAILRSDALVFGGGSILKELYASVGRNRYATLGMILATVTFAKQVARRRVVMSNIGAGPLETPCGKHLARWILKQVDFVSLRDEKSLQTCRELGIPEAKLRRVPDAVFANPPQVFVPDPRPVVKNERLRIALNLNYDIANRAAWEGFLDRLAGALRELNDRTPLELHALPMQSTFKAHDDLSVLKEFAGRLPDVPLVMHDPQSAQAVGALIAASDLVLAERLHTLVIASILGKPFFGLVYDVKVAELVESLGMTRYSIDINRAFDAADLRAGLEALYADRAAVGRRLTERSAALHTEVQAYFSELRARLQ